MSIEARRCAAAEWTAACGAVYALGRPMGELDIALRSAATRGAADIAAAVLRDAGAALSLRWLDSQVVRTERCAGKRCLLEFAERRKLLHVEWFAALEAELGWRT